MGKLRHPSGAPGTHPAQRGRGRSQPHAEPGQGARILKLPPHCVPVPGARGPALPHGAPTSLWGRPAAEKMGIFCPRAMLFITSMGEMPVWIISSG